METYLLIVGGIVVVCLHVSVASLVLWLAAKAIKEIDWQAARIIARRQIVRERCLEPADSMVAQAIREGREPFDEGSRFIRRQWEWLHEETGIPFPTNYPTS